MADDSEDEKRIEKAERAAERRAQAKRRKETVVDGRKRAPHGRKIEMCHALFDGTENI